MSKIFKEKQRYKKKKPNNYKIIIKNKHSELLLYLINSYKIIKTLKTYGTKECLVLKK